MEIEQIYREVAPKLQSYLMGNGCSHATACDIVQETFLRLWKRKDELSDDPHMVSGLAFAVARNCRNDLMRKAQHEVFVESDGGESGEAPFGEVLEVARPVETDEECAELRRRLKLSLGRMPVELLEAFALSRLGNLTTMDIARGTGLSEANVKVRIHRAKEMIGGLLGAENCGTDAESSVVRGGKRRLGWAILRSVMMLAAVDGEISKDELSLYRGLAERMRGENAFGFEAMWSESVKGMAYIGFISEMLSPEELVREFVREAREAFAANGAEKPQDWRCAIRTLERMASADGEYSRIERACVSALAQIATG